MPLIAYLEKNPLFRDHVLPLIASPTRRRLASGAFWGGVGGVVSRGTVLVTSFFLARILGQAQFGEYGIVNSTSAMLSAVAGLGVGTTATRYVAQLRNTDKERTGRIISLSSMITWISGSLYGLAFVVLAPWLAEKTLAAPHLAQVLRISSISVALGVINGAQQCSLAGFEAFRISALVNIGGSLFQSVAVCLGAWHGGVKGAVTGMAASTLVIVVMTRCALHVEMRRFGVRNWWREAWVEWPILISFSLPAFLTTIISGPVFWACNAFLANQSNGYNELGILNAANQWGVAVAFFPGVLMTAVLPVLSEQAGVRDVDGNVRIVKRMMRVTALILIPLALVLCMLSPLIMRGYGKTFAPGYTTLILSVAAVVPQAITTPCWYAMMANGRMWACFILNCGWSVLLLTGTFLLARYGAVGVAGARLIAFVIHGCWIYAYVRIRSGDMRVVDACDGYTE
ncbi:MAG: oligosaccharide flippase family protein [Kiritimatiellia bacterium]|jgi:O-antigen/teichoic acid export membrane protein